jgi:CheY-like chemotaxis protein
VVTDIGLPDDDGYALLRALLQENGGSVRAVALTGFAGAEDRERLAAAGFRVHLAKPVDPEKLIAVIRDLAAEAKS